MSKKRSALAELHASNPEQAEQPNLLETAETSGETSSEEGTPVSDLIVSDDETAKIKKKHQAHLDKLLAGKEPKERYSLLKVQAHETELLAQVIASNIAQAEKIADPDAYIAREVERIVGERLAAMGRQQAARNPSAAKSNGGAKRGPRAASGEAEARAARFYKAIEGGAQKPHAIANAMAEFGTSKEERTRFKNWWTAARTILTEGGHIRNVGGARVAAKYEPTGKAYPNA